MYYFQFLLVNVHNVKCIKIRQLKIFHFGFSMVNTLNLKFNVTPKCAFKCIIQVHERH